MLNLKEIQSVKHVHSVSAHVSTNDLFVELRKPKTKRKLKGNWLVEIEDELNAEYGLDIEDDLIKFITEDLEVEAKAVNYANNPAYLLDFEAAFNNAMANVVPFDEITGKIQLNLSQSVIYNLNKDIKRINGKVQS